MKLFFADAQLAHQPKQYMVHGRIVDPFENPNRATTLVDALARLGLARTEPADFGREPILKVHADHYVTFLRACLSEAVCAIPISSHGEPRDWRERNVD